MGFFLSSARKARRKTFTLLELILVIGIMAFLLIECSDVLIQTLRTQNDLREMYVDKRVKSIGWNNIYEDLSNAVGIYYLDGTNWGDQQKIKPKKPPKVPRKSRGVRKDIVTKKISVKKIKFSNLLNRKVSKDQLFLFQSESEEDPFIEMVVSHGKIKRDPEDRGMGFRLVKYFIRSHPDEKGQLILRTEQKWVGASKENEEVETEPDLDGNYKRYAVMEGIENIELSVYNGEEWVEEWDSLKKGDLPLAIRIRYLEVDPEGEDNPFTDQDREVKFRVIPIPISNVVVKEPLEDLEI